VKNNKWFTVTISKEFGNGNTYRINCRLVASSEKTAKKEVMKHHPQYKFESCTED
jgi:hypothetical protein